MRDCYVNGDIRGPTPICPYMGDPSAGDGPGGNPLGPVPGTNGKPRFRASNHEAALGGACRRRASRSSCGTLHNNAASGCGRDAGCVVS